MDKRRFAAFRAPCALLFARAAYCAIVTNTSLKNGLFDTIRAARKHSVGTFAIFAWWICLLLQKCTHNILERAAAARLFYTLCAVFCFSHLAVAFLLLWHSFFRCLSCSFLFLSLFLFFCVCVVVSFLLSFALLFLSFVRCFSCFALL